MAGHHYVCVYDTLCWFVYVLINEKFHYNQNGSLWRGNRVSTL